MKVTVEFHCEKCGLLTPGIAYIPDRTDHSKPIRLAHECFHCGAPLKLESTAGDLAKAQELAEFDPTDEEQS